MSISSHKTPFPNRSRFAMPKADSPLSSLVSSVTKELTNSGPIKREVSRASFALEGFAEDITNSFSESQQKLGVALQRVATEHFMAMPNVRKQGEEVKTAFTKAQLFAGTVAGMMAGAPEDYLGMVPQYNKPSMEGYLGTFIPARDGTIIERRFAAEAYDERDNKNAVVYSTVYNMQAAKQDEFGEAFFPTVVVTPDQTGYHVCIRLIQVFDELHRNASGALDKFNKKNIIRAVIDPTILENDSTDIIPVYTTGGSGSSANFVSSSDVAPSTILMDGQPSFSTSPLAIDASFSLLGLSQTPAILNSGFEDQYDAIDTDVVLKSIYIKLTGTVSSATVTEVFKFDTEQLPLAVFNYSVQDNYRVMQLAFRNNAPLFKSTSLTVSGSASQLLAPLASGGQYAARLDVNVYGTVNLELGDTQLTAAPVKVDNITDAFGVTVATTGSPGTALYGVFTGATIIGYDLKARRTNSNRRTRGQLVDTTFYNQVYAVPLLSPITAGRPVGGSADNQESSDLAALITTTHVRTSNSAVSRLISVRDMLNQYVNTTDNINNPPDILGVARFLVTPWFESQTYNAPDVVDSIKSSERAEDIQQSLISLIRDMAYRGYRNSGYKAAADARAGGVADTPTVIIGTDVVISRYLQVTGDFRTLGPDFNVKIVATLNENVAGQIFFTFGEFGTGKDGVPNPLHFGNMAWKPELTLVIPMTRNGSISKELSVSPSYLHVVNLPILMYIVVTGIEDVVVAKNAINFHSV